MSIMITLFENPKINGEEAWNLPYLTRAQVANYLQVSERKIVDMTAKGEIPAVKLGGGKNSAVRYRKTAVDEALAKMRIG